MLVVAGCSDGHTDVRATAGAGWPSYGGGGANANFTGATVPDDLVLAWTRPTGGPVTAPLTISEGGAVGVTAQTADGCNMLVLDSRAGRKNFCKRLAPGAQFNAMAVDQYDQPYIGESTMLLSFTGGGGIRWRYPVYGVALSAKFAGPGLLLNATTQGQVMLFNTQTGDFMAPELLLRDDVDFEDPLRGLGDCITGGPGCGIPAPPAVDPAAERFFLNVRPEGSDGSVLRAFGYAEGDDGREMTDLWQAEVPGGMMGPPALSVDGDTVYAFGRSGELLAYDAASGDRRWSFDNGGFGFGTLSVSPTGEIIPTGAVGAPLRMIRDHGDRAELAWERTDLPTAGLSTLTTYGTGWTVARDPVGDGLSLVEFDTSDGAPQRALSLPDSRGFTTGVAVSAGGQIAVATNLGQVYFFNSESAIEAARAG